MVKILTVSIAAFNVESFINNTLESVCKSKYIDLLDVIVQTNGATDKTSIISKKWANKYPNSVRVVDVEHNHGYGFTINNSIRLARGLFFKQLDGDDWFDTAEFDELISCLFNVSSDAILTDYVYFYEDTKNTKRIGHPFDSHCVLPISKISMYSMHSLTIKTNYLKNPNLAVTEDCYYTDVEFFVKALNRINSFSYLPFAVYYYRWNREGQSMSYKSIVAHIKEHEIVCRNCLNLVTANTRLVGLKDTIETLAIKHLSYLLCCAPSKENYKAFIEYKKFLSSKKIKYRRRFKSIVIMAIIMPRLFYKSISRLKRRKYKINSNN